MKAFQALLTFSIILRNLCLLRIRFPFSMHSFICWNSL